MTNFDAEDKNYMSSAFCVETDLARYHWLATNWLHPQTQRIIYGPIYHFNFRAARLVVVASQYWKRLSNFTELSD